MTVGQLIVELTGLDSNMRVILSGDSEGNHFHDCHTVGSAEDNDLNEVIILWPGSESVEMGG